MYQAYKNGNLFWSSDLSDNGFLLNDISITKGAGLAGSAAFVVNTENLQFGNFEKFADYIEIVRDEETIFYGRVVDVVRMFDLTEKITCEGIKAVLNDTVYRPKLYEGTLANLINDIIDSHNDQVEEDKQIQVGTIDYTDSNVYREYENYETTLSRLDDLVSSYGGYMNVSKTNNGLVLDWVSDYIAVSTQEIVLGENILDIEQEELSEDFATVIIPLGADYELADGTRKKLTIESVNGGLDYLADNQAVSEYGAITAVVEWNDVTQPAILLTKAQAKLQELKTPRITITVRAVDIANAGYNVEHFEIGHAVRVTSKPHGIENVLFVIKELTINPFSPQSDELTLGTETSGYIGNLQRQNSKYYELIQRVNSNYAVNKDLKAVSRTVETHSSQIEQNAENITLRATTSYVDQEINSAKAYAYQQMQNAETYAESVLQTFVDGDFQDAIDDLQAQLDGVVDSYFEDYTPTASNYPASDWTTEALRQEHEGDTFTNRNTGDSYKWLYKENVWQWVIIQDSMAAQALAMAAEAKETADGKRRVFISTQQHPTPYPPYDEGDLWTDGDDLKYCITPRTSGVYTSTDWVLATDYANSIATIEADLQVKATEIASKVSQTDFNGQNIASLINQTADTVKIVASHIELSGNDIADRINASGTNVIIDEDHIDISSKANVSDVQNIASDVSGLTQRVTSAETDIAANANAIQLRATKAEVVSAIDAIEIGSKNMLWNTNGTSMIPLIRNGNMYFTNPSTITSKQMADWVRLPNRPFGDIRHGAKLTCTTTSNQQPHGVAFYEGSEGLSFVYNQYYTMSCWVYTTASGVSIKATVQNPSSGLPASFDGDDTYTVDVATQWKRCVWKFKYLGTANETRKILFEFLFDKVSTVYLAGFQLERGNTVSDWQDFIEPVIIGGANLIYNTNDPNLTSRIPSINGLGNVAFSENTNNYVTEHGVGTALLVNNQYPFIQFGSDEIVTGLYGLEAGEMYTFSSKFKARLFSGASGTDRYALLAYAYDNGTTPTTYGRTDWKQLVVWEEYETGAVKEGRIQFTFSITENATAVKFIVFAQNTDTSVHIAGDYIELYDIKLERGNGASDWQPASYDLESESQAIADILNDEIEVIQTQVDQKIQTYYQAADPIDYTQPATELAKYIGDMWYKTTDGTTWRFDGTQWQEQDVPTAVFDKIDGKAQVFVSQPTTPYLEGDLWFNSTTSDIMTCVHSRYNGNYTASDWQKRNKYTDDTAAETAQAGVNSLNTRMTQAELKITDSAIVSTVISSDAFGNSVDSLIEQNADSIRMKADTIVWQADNSSMTSSGILTCNGANIYGDVIMKDGLHEAAIGNYTTYLWDLIQGIRKVNYKNFHYGIKPSENSDNFKTVKTFVEGDGRFHEVTATTSRRYRRFVYLAKGTDEIVYQNETPYMQIVEDVEVDVDNNSTYYGLGFPSSVNYGSTGGIVNYKITPSGREITLGGSSTVELHGDGTDFDITTDSPNYSQWVGNQLKTDDRKLYFNNNRVITENIVEDYNPVATTKSKTYTGYATGRASQYGQVIVLNFTINLNESSYPSTVPISPAVSIGSYLPKPIAGTPETTLVQRSSSYTQPLRVYVNSSGNLYIQSGARGTYYGELVYICKEGETI